jgi:hypothetical protein
METGALLGAAERVNKLLVDIADLAVPIGKLQLQSQGTD